MIENIQLQYDSAIGKITLIRTYFTNYKFLYRRQKSILAPLHIVFFCLNKYNPFEYHFSILERA